MEDTSSLEYGRRRRLERARALPHSRGAQSSPRSRQHLSSAGAIMYALAGGIALLADSADFVVGWIPIAGDILDVLVLLVIETLFIFRAFFDLKSRALIPIGLIGMACLGELIPVFGDLPPTWIGAVFLAWQLERRYESAKHRFRSLRGRAGMRQLFSPVRSASHEGYTQP